MNLGMQAQIMILAYYSLYTYYIAFAPNNYEDFVHMMFNSMVLMSSLYERHLGFKINNKLCDYDYILRELKKTFIYTTYALMF